MPVNPSFFSGSYGGDNSKIADHSRLECTVCWYVYDPDAGDSYWHIPPGTPFAQLPEYWTCPQCDGLKNAFMVVEQQE